MSLSERAARQSLGPVGESTRRIMTEIWARATDGYYSLDREWRFTDINDRALAYLELTREAVVGQTLFEVFPSLAGSTLDDAYRHAVRARVPVHFDHHSVTVDRWAEVHAYPLEDGLVVHFRDITDRKRVEVRRERDRARLDALIAASADLLAETSVQGVLRSAVRASVQLTGATSGVAGRRSEDGHFEGITSNDSDDPGGCPRCEQFVRTGVANVPASTGKMAALRLSEAELRADPGRWGIPPAQAPLGGLLMCHLVAPDCDTNGLIAVFDKRHSDGSPGEFEAEDEALLVQLATLASLALQHIAARHEAEQRAHANVQLLTTNRQQRDFLESLVQSAPVGIAVVRGPEHRFELVNPAYQSIVSGRPDQPMIGRPFRDVFPYAADAATLMLDRVYAEGVTISVSEFPANVGPGRTDTLWDVDQVPLHAAGGAVDGVLIITNEVTQRVSGRRQLERLASEARQRAGEMDAALSAIADGLVIYAHDGKVVRMSEMARKILGYSAPMGETTLGERAMMTQPCRPDGRPFAIHELPTMRALAGDVVHNEIMLLRTPEPGGEGWQTTWVSASAAPICGPDASPQGAVATFSDITALYQTQAQLEAAVLQLKGQQERLRASEARLRRLRDSNIIGVLYAGSDGIIYDANDAFLSMVGYSRSEQINWLAMTPPEYAPRDQRAIEEAQVQGACNPYEKEYLRKDGRRVPVLIGFAQLEDEPGHFVCFIVDLTDRKRAEALREAMLASLRQAREELELRVIQRTTELSQREAALTQANVALAESRQQLQTLSRRLVQVQEDERRAIARELHDETGQSLTTLMVGLGLLQRECGCDDLISVRFGELKEITRSVMEGIRHLAVSLRPASLDKLGLAPALRQFVDNLSKQSGLVIESDWADIESRRMAPEVETAVYRIVQEALTNVVRHAHASKVGLILTRRDGRVLTVIEDNGIGFDVAAALQSGRLGLLGMRERAEMLDGTLVIESIPGLGTTVIVEMPG